MKALKHGVRSGLILWMVATTATHGKPKKMKMI